MTDFGTGADGACVLSGAGITNKTYNCTSLSIPAGTHTFAAGSGITIKVQGDVSIVGTLDLRGGNGQAGQSAAVSTAGTAAPGGFAGGAGCGTSACTPGNGSSPDSSSHGVAGTSGNDNGSFLNAGGGGGSGANHNPTTNGASGVNGTNGGGTAISGNGATAPTTNYGSELQFSVTMNGGSGGGAGGAGDSGTLVASGGAGGGGGGVLKIFAQGNIDITGSIDVRGGNGGNGLWSGANGPSAGGGGGSGGAIWLYSKGDITLSTSTALRAEGGGAGAQSANGGVIGGAGGVGGTGRVRLDDIDGSVANAPSYATILSTQTQFESDISAGCGTIVDVNKQDPPSGNGFFMPLYFLIPMLMILILKGKKIIKE